MAWTTTELNALVDYAASRAVYVSLHTADPGSTGANEAAGVSRIALSWAAASGGSKSAAQVTFSVPAGTYTHWGLWSASSGGTFRGGWALSQSQTRTGTDTVLLTVTIPLTQV